MPFVTGNINLEGWASSCPVDTFKQSSEPELYDITGNVWQWNETPMHPFDGFKVHPLYDDFTTPTYDTQHNLIMGGSWVSTGNEATKKARYALLCVIHILYLYSMRNSSLMWLFDWIFAFNRERYYSNIQICLSTALFPTCWSSLHCFKCTN